MSDFFSFCYKRFVQLALALMAFTTSSNAGKPVDWQIWYQDPATPVMEKINDMHIGLMWTITAILIFVTAILVVTVFKFRESKNPTPSKTTHNVPLEILWTLVPVIIVASIAYPSIKLIYYMDKVENPDMTLKVIGHQWYWEYDYPDHGVAFDSFMLNRDQLQPGQLRNLEVDKRVVVPVDTNIRVLTTSADVLHAFAVPAFGIKSDTIPGRIRETWMRITKPGVYYGQCSELCGSGHGFMSIAVEAVSREEFEAWVKKEGGSLPTDVSATAEIDAAGSKQLAESPEAPVVDPNPDALSTEPEKDSGQQEDDKGMNAAEQDVDANTQPVPQNS